jgi:sugar phosphate isomerase/epimerase
MVIGAQTSSVRIAFSSLACPGWSVEEIASAAGRFGYDGIEWRLADGELLGPKTPDVVWQRIASCGVETACLDTSCVFVVATDEQRAKAVSYAAAMGERAAATGASAMRVFGGQIPDGASDRAALVAVTRDALSEAVARMPSGVTLMIETHDAWSRGADVAELVEGLDGVGVIWDIAHSWRQGEKPSETLAHISVPGMVHVKDALGDELLPIGSGDVPLAEAVGALRDVGFNGWLSFEWEKLWHPTLAEPEVALPAGAEALRRLLS